MGEGGGIGPANFKLQTHQLMILPHILLFCMENYFPTIEEKISMLWKLNLDESLRKSRRRFIPIFSFLKGFSFMVNYYFYAIFFFCSWGM